MYINYTSVTLIKKREMGIFHPPASHPSVRAPPSAAVRPSQLPMGLAKSDTPAFPGLLSLPALLNLTNLLGFNLRPLNCGLVPFLQGVAPLLCSHC